MKKKILKNRIKRTGFTLIESLIAITILMISVAAPLKSAGDGIIAANYAKQEITAFYLAEDALEYIRNVKTTNSFKGESMTNYLASCDISDPDQSNGCKIGTYKNYDVAATTYDNASDYLKLNDDGEYSYSTGDNTIFKRQIKITPTKVTGVITEMKVEVTVYWHVQNGDEKSYTLSTNLVNW